MRYLNMKIVQTEELTERSAMKESAVCFFLFVHAKNAAICATIDSTPDCTVEHLTSMMM